MDLENDEPHMSHDLSTDIYGRRFTPQQHNQSRALHSETDPVVIAEEQEELQLVKRLEGSLDSTFRRFRKRDSDKKEEQVILTYAETLHKGLKVMWVPMVYFGRMPFRLLLRNNHALIVVNKWSTVYRACQLVCIFTWVAFIWITLGLILLLSDDVDTQSNSNLMQTARISHQLASQWWIDTFIFWTTLLQACISTSHILHNAESFAMFIKAWYRVLDITKIEVSRTLTMYIIASQATLFLFILACCVMHFLPESFAFMEGTAQVIVIAIAQPFIVFFKLTDSFTRFQNGKFYFEKFADLGLLVYVLAMIFSWMYIMQFMVFCRCFRIGLKSINQRIAMILNVNDEPRVGPNALRLTYEYIHKDYLGIATTGIKIGQIFSWTMGNYYLWAMLVVVLELGEIFIFAKEDYRKPVAPEIKQIFNGTNFPERLSPIQQVTKNLLHLTVTSVCIFYVSYEGSGAQQEGKYGYELGRYKGLVNCSTQLERNFIRSIWIIITEKCPVHVSPGKYFGVTSSTVMTVLATAFTYFVFWVQSQGQLGSAGTHREEVAESTIQHVSMGGLGGFSAANDDIKIDW